MLAFQQLYRLNIMLTKIKLYFIRSEIKALVEQRKDLLDAIQHTRAGVQYVEEEIRKLESEADMLTTAAAA